MLCRVTGSIGAVGSVDDGCESRLCAGGGVGPPRTTVEINPEFCSASISFRWNFVSGTDVSPNRALLAFCRCEQALARWTRDMVDETAMRGGYELVVAAAAVRVAIVVCCTFGGRGGRWVSI